MSEKPTVTATEKRVLQDLIGRGEADAATKESVFRHYERRGRFTQGLQTVARRGGAARVYWQLVDKGFIKDGKISRLGRRAAQ